MKVLKQAMPLYQQAYLEIKRLILVGKFKPGSTIMVSQLVDEFQISRTPLKEALRQLQNDGLLEPNPMGHKVVQLNRKDISELCYCRLVLEKEMISLVVDVITEAELNEIQEILTNTEICVREGANTTQFFEYNSSFHSIIMDACPNKMLLQLLDTTRNKLMLYRAIAIKENQDQLKILEEHKEIYTALKQKDKIKAIKAIENHLKSDETRYISVME